MCLLLALCCVVAAELEAVFSEMKDKAAGVRKTKESLTGTSPCLWSIGLCLCDYSLK